MRRLVAVCVGCVALAAAGVLTAVVLLGEAERDAEEDAARAVVSAADVRALEGALLGRRARDAAAAGRREAAARTPRGRARIRASEREARRRAAARLGELRRREAAFAADAADATDRAEARDDAARIVALAGGGGVLLLALVSGVGLGAAVHWRLEAAALAARAAGTPPRVEREVDLVRLTREAAERLRPQAEERGVELELALDGVPPCLGEPERIEQAVADVVGAALRGTEPGGGVQVRLSTLGEAAVLEVVGSPGPGGATATFRIELPLRAAGVASPAWR